jgi:hypothetical protein
MTLPWFKFSPAQWMMGRISRQSAEVQIAFLRLCCSYWTDGCTMSSERAALELEHHYDRLIALKMIEDIDGEISIKFLDDQAQELEARRGKLSAAGRASSLKRSKTLNTPSTDVEQKPVKIDKKRKENQPAVDDGFDLFWSKYPRKENKLNSRKAWAKLTGPDRAVAIEKLNAAFDGKPVEYIPHAATWLNARRFEDESKPITNQHDDTGHQHFY